MKSKYSNVLTIALIIVIILIVIGIGFLIYGIVSDIQNNKNKEEIIAQFDAEIQNAQKQNDIDDSNINIIAPDAVKPNNNSAPKKQYYEGEVMIGYIEIKKTNIKYPILETATKKALETAVAVTYPESNPRLNEPGNVVIAGHNYHNGKMFSNNNKLSVGDKIHIKSNNGTTMTYTIYEKFETDVSDTSYMIRDTGGAIEISLTTCVENNSPKRLIILARAEQ